MSKPIPKPPAGSTVTEINYHYYRHAMKTAWKGIIIIGAALVILGIPSVITAIITDNLPRLISELSSITIGGVLIVMARRNRRFDI